MSKTTNTKLSNKYIKVSLSDYKKIALSNWRAKFDRFIVVLGAVNVVATLPQLYQMWQPYYNGGVSIPTWAYYVFFTVVLLVYSITIKSKPMTIMYTGNTIVYILVLVSAIIKS